MKIETRLKVRVRADGRSDVFVLVNHPMEGAFHRDATTERTAPARCLHTLVVTLNGIPAASADLGPGVSANPLFRFRLQDTRRGDVVGAEWVDSLGARGRAETAIT